MVVFLSIIVSLLAIVVAVLSLNLHLLKKSLRSDACDVRCLLGGLDSRISSAERSIRDNANGLNAVADQCQLRYNEVKGMCNYESIKKTCLAYIERGYSTSEASTLFGIPSSTINGWKKK